MLEKDVRFRQLNERKNAILMFKERNKSNPRNYLLNQVQNIQILPNKREHGGKESNQDIPHHYNTQEDHNY